MLSMFRNAGARTGPLETTISGSNQLQLQHKQLPKRRLTLVTVHRSPVILHVQQLAPSRRHKQRIRDVIIPQLNLRQHHHKAHLGGMHRSPQCFDLRFVWRADQGDGRRHRMYVIYRQLGRTLEHAYPASSSSRTMKHLRIRLQIRSFSLSIMES